MLYHLLCFCLVLACSARLLPGQAGIPFLMTFTGTGSCSYAADGSSFGPGFGTGTNCTSGAFAFWAKFDFGLGAFQINELFRGIRCAPAQGRLMARVRNCNTQASAVSGFGSGWTHEWIHRQAYREAQNGNPA